MTAETLQRRARFTTLGLACLAALATGGGLVAAHRLVDGHRHGGRFSAGWHILAGTVTGVVLVTVSVLPLAALAVWVLARWRSATGDDPAWAWRRSLAEVGLVYGTVPWV